MAGWTSVGAALVVTLVMMAGCAGTAPIPEIQSPAIQSPSTTPQGPDPTPPTTFGLGGTDCQAMTFVMLAEPDQANDLLPAGFYAGDASGLLDLPVKSGKAAFVLTWMTCQTATGDDGPVIFGTFAIFIEHPPTTPGAADRDLFVLEHWNSWPGLASWLAAWGSEAAGNASLDFTPHADGRTPLPPGVARPDPGPSAMSVVVAAEHGAGFQGHLAGTTGYHMDGVVFRFWFTSPEATLWLDLVPDRNATGGSGFCQYGLESDYAMWTGEAACGEQGLIGLALPSANVVASGVVVKKGG